MSAASSMDRMHYVGLDIHARESSLEILNDRGQTVKRQTIRGNWDDLAAEVAKLPRPLSICYEASCGYGTLHEKLSPLAKRLLVAHPGQLRLIWKSKRKNNKFDASKLAKLLCLKCLGRMCLVNFSFCGSRQPDSIDSCCQ